MVNSRRARFAATSFEAPLLPKLRGQFAEFLSGTSLARLRLLASPTCVGLRYGQVVSTLHGFSRLQSQSLRSPEGSLRRPSVAAGASAAFQLCARPILKRHRLAPPPGVGMLTHCPSPTAFALDLGPPNLQRTNLPEEPLGFRRTGFSPVFSLLVPAFSLLHAPVVLPLHLHCEQNAPLPLPLLRARRFGNRLEPPYIIGAGSHSTSQLLRTV